jgi:RNA polymerase sigma factor (sigma-70 family)
MSTPSDRARWFSEHIQPHEPMLRAWLRGRFEAACDVDDLVQEAYVRVWRAYEHGSVVSPKAFLFSTARNLALDHVRRQQIVPMGSLHDGEAQELLDDATDVAELASRNQELALLTEAIQSLPARCRQIVTLRTVYGMAQHEIARELGISFRTVSTQVKIGLHKCTDYMLRRTQGKGPR